MKELQLIRLAFSMLGAAQQWTRKSDEAVPKSLSYLGTRLALSPPVQKSGTAQTIRTLAETDVKCICDTLDANALRGIAEKNHQAVLRYVYDCAINMFCDFLGMSGVAKRVQRQMNFHLYLVNEFKNLLGAGIDEHTLKDTVRISFNHMLSRYRWDAIEGDRQGTVNFEDDDYRKISQKYGVGSIDGRIAFGEPAELPDELHEA
jgi:hypothetical protein